MDKTCCFSFHYLELAQGYRLCHYLGDVGKFFGPSWDSPVPRGGGGFVNVGVIVVRCVLFGGGGWVKVGVIVVRCVLFGIRGLTFGIR